ncbi:MAG: ABC transporter ATP-binding protein [Pseudomonadota bacterium]
MSALLDIDGLRAFYGDAAALHGIGLSIAQGEVVALLGANGAGKTTTLRAICALIRTDGRVTFDGRDIRGLATEEIVRLGIAHVPEGRGTFSELTVAENLKLGGISRKDKARVQEDIDRVLGYFPRLKERWGQQAGTLSGGEQQMLAIARALMLRPRLMLLDEPSFGLAPLVVQEIFRIMKRINQEEGVSMLIVEQNARLALALADRAYLLETGRIVMHGPSAQISADESIQRAYLGYSAASPTHSPDMSVPDVHDNPKAGV